MPARERSDGFLVVRGGLHDGATISLSGKELRLGRDGTNDVIVVETQVSRVHARIRKEKPGY